MTPTGEPTADRTPRAHAVDVMNRAGATHRTLDAEVELVRREARRRFGGLVLDTANPGTHFRNRENRPIDRRVFRQAGELGLFGFSLPVEAGGAGRDKLAWGVVVEELSRLSRDPGLAVLIDISVEITELILSSGSPELIGRYVPDLVAGRRFGVQGAYENRDPYDYRSTARLDGDTWVLNGAKRFIAGACFADLFVLFLREEGSNDMLAFAVEKDDPGVSAVPLDTMGLHTMGLGQVLLDDVRLPQWRLVWRADALSELNTYARIRRTMSACGVLGALDGVTEACVEALADRRRTGRRVLDHTNVERSVGELRMLLQTSRAAVHRALDGTRSPDRDPHFDEFATVAKHHAAECALRVGQVVMGLQGGEAYMSAFPWERFMRDVLGLISGQGSQEMLLVQLGQRTIVGLEGRRVREEAAERNVAKLADAWWALHAATTAEPSEATRAVVAAARLDDLDGLGADDRARCAAFLDRAHALVAAVRAGRAPDALPPGPSGLAGGRPAELAAGARGLLACALARETGLLTRLLEPCTVAEAVGDLPTGLTKGLTKGLTEDLLDVLLDVGVVRRDTDGRHLVDPGLERVLIGGPRTGAFAARLRRALAGGARLHAPAASAPGPAAPAASGPGSPSLGAREAVPGCGDEAAATADALVTTALGQLEGLTALLERPGARIGCAAADGGRSAAALARQIPFVPVLSLEPARPTDGTTGDPAATPTKAPTDGTTGDPADGTVESRPGSAADFTPDDGLALAWLPAATLGADALGPAVDAAAGALLPGGWLLLPCPLLPRRPLGAAAARLDLALTGGRAPAPAELEAALRSAGLTQLRTPWSDPALGLTLLAARRP
ncbi:acyl-CoA dehydrogenase family protein [Kitasatospora sp. NPDC058170]|uniref:acyl-CoA dehydrogenase family protein n=1 Tax=Kitasatospora sp. NPDC058170 TaxID=3346364 RepID=UPI0036D7D8FC